MSLRVDSTIVREFINNFRNIQELIALKSGIDKLNIERTGSFIDKVTNYLRNSQGSDAALFFDEKQSVSHMIFATLNYLRKSLGLSLSGEEPSELLNGGNPDWAVKHFISALTSLVVLLSLHRDDLCFVFTQQRENYEQKLKLLQLADLDSFLVNAHEDLKLNYFLGKKQLKDFSYDDNSFLAMTKMCSTLNNNLNDSSEYTDFLKAVVKMANSIDGRPFMVTSIRRTLKTMGIDLTAMPFKDKIPYQILDQIQGNTEQTYGSVLEKLLKVDNGFNCGAGVKRGSGDDDDDDVVMSTRKRSKLSTLVRPSEKTNEALHEMNVRFQRIMNSFNVALANILNNKTGDLDGDLDPNSQDPLVQLNNARIIRHKLIELINSNMTVLGELLTGFVDGLRKIDQTEMSESADTIKLIAQLKTAADQREETMFKFSENIDFFLLASDRIDVLRKQIKVLEHKYDAMAKKNRACDDLTLAMVNVSFNSLKTGNVFCLQFIPLTVLEPLSQVAGSYPQIMKTLQPVFAQENLFVNVNTFNVLPIEYIVLNSSKSNFSLFSNTNLLKELLDSRADALDLFTNEVVRVLCYHLQKTDARIPEEKHLAIKHPSSPASTTTTNANHNTSISSSYAAKIVTQLFSTIPAAEQPRFVRGVSLLTSQKFSRGAANIFITALINFLEPAMIFARLTDSNTTHLGQILETLCVNKPITRALFAKMFAYFVLGSNTLTSSNQPGLFTIEADVTGKAIINKCCTTISQDPAFGEALRTENGIKIESSGTGFDISFEKQAEPTNYTDTQSLRISPNYFRDQTESPSILSIFDYISTAESIHDTSDFMDRGTELFAPRKPAPRDSSNRKYPCTFTAPNTVVPVVERLLLIRAFNFNLKSTVEIKRFSVVDGVEVCFVDVELDPARGSYSVRVN